MDKITAFIMTHPDVTIEIKKDPNFYQSIDIKMKKNNAACRDIIGENRLTALESILSYMYDVVSNREQEEQDVKVCCICGELFDGLGHNPWPYETEGRCCDACNYNIVVPRRIANFRNSETNTNPSCSTCTHENEKWNSEACFNCNQDNNYEARK